MKTRKELKDAYKQMKFRMGVFQIRNTVNGKIYIESSVNLDAIWNRHRFQLNAGNHPNNVLQQDWNTYGESQFCYEILAELEQDEDGGARDYSKDLKALELLYVEELEPFGEKGYNG
ncbi:MAG: GIY-YIG nuclease family protein [Bacteroidetes bacterium]|nr:MAG: GIY-YIG nuclease family protein [Bacteroidota bacterium]